MDLKVLGSFQKVAELANISQASAQLGYAQSTVTTQIRQLERELDVQLFDRLGNRIYLTAAGTAFLQYANEILSLMEQAKESLHCSPFPRGVLKVAGIHSLCASFLPQRIKAYESDYPAVKIEIVTGVVGEVLEQVRKGNADIAFYMDFEEAENDLTVAYQEKNPLLFVCGNDNRLANIRNLTLSDIVNEPFIATEKDCCYRKKLEQLFLSQELEPNIYFATGNTDIIKKFVENNIGIALLPEIAVRTELAEQKLTRLDMNEIMPEAVIRLVYHKNKWVTPTIRAFVELYSKKYRENR